MKLVNADGSTRDVDPAAYLAEIAQRGNLKLTAMYDGQDLLAKYRSSEVAEGVGSALADGQMSPEEWIRKLLSSEDSGIGLGSSDSLMDIVVSAFSSLMALALSLDNNGKEEKMAAATEAAANRRIELTALASKIYNENINTNLSQSENIQIR